MSLPELIPSNLPVYVQNKARTAFSNSVVPSGSVLLFAESDGNGGSNLIAKNPDGSFTEIGGGGGSTNFYKCASVDTTNHTWTGYKAVLNQSGYYEFESTVTSSGLTYSTVTPEVDKVYSADALVKADLWDGIPTYGLVFYASLKNNSIETGNTLSTRSGSVTYGTVDNIPCAYFSDFSGDISNAAAIPYGSDPRTFSMWFKMDTVPESYQYFLVEAGTEQAGNNFAIVVHASTQKATLTDWGALPDFVVITTNTVTDNTWHHLAIVYDGTAFRLYLDGVLNSEYTGTTNTVQNYFSIGRNAWDSRMTGYMAGLRIYNRALTATEIAALANELKPTYS